MAQVNLSTKVKQIHREPQNSQRMVATGERWEEREGQTRIWGLVDAKSEEELKSLLKKVKGEWKSWLKAQHSEN